MQGRAGRLGMTLGLFGAIALLLAAVAAAYARGDAKTPAAAAAPQAAAIACSSAKIGVMGPFTGPAASIGQEQLKWARYGLGVFNKAGKTNYKMVESDTQLDAAQAATRSVQLKANKDVLVVVGPAGSQEVQAVAKTYRGMPYISASATNTSLTIGAKRIKTFFRVVGNDAAQSVTDATFIRKDLKATRVWIIDDQTSYSVPLANGVQAQLKKAGATVTRDSVNQDQSDFSSLVTRIASNTQVVFLPWQLAAKATLFYQQLREQGKTATVMGSDGLDSGDFLPSNGSYFSAFAPDIRKSKNKKVKAAIKAYVSRYGSGAFKSNFGPPMYMATQAAYVALKAACKDGKATRAEVLKQLPKVNLKSSLLGYPIKFNKNHDPIQSRFFIFKVTNGKTQFVK
jgi:branched-chain amino acid transport system substrate-binding protein